MNYMNSLANRLKKARQDCGYTQNELAKMVGAYQTKYQNWESGNHEPDIDTINKLADVLGVSADWLLGRGTEKPYPNEFDKEMLLFRETVRPYGPEIVKRMRESITKLYGKPSKKVDADTIKSAQTALDRGRQALKDIPARKTKKKSA